MEKEYRETESPYHISVKPHNNRTNKRRGEGIASGRGRSRDSSHTHSDSSSDTSGDDDEGVESERDSGHGFDVDRAEYHMLVSLTSIVSHTNRSIAFT